MSIDCRYFTNGTKTAYTLKHTDTGMVEEFEKFEEIPVGVREHFKRLTTPKFCGPDLSTILGLNSVFYPDWPKACGHPDYQGKRCIAESCKYADEAGGWEKCLYLQSGKGEALNDAD
ncbi:MAG: hypothetical protein ACLVDB_00720 [Anaeromassilibacillus sp.]|jgi:hypothetical protein